MKFKDFMTNKKIGIVGFSDDSYIPKEETVRAYFRQGLKDLGLDGDKNLIIVSGTTNMGVPKICYEEARKMGFKTVGITAEEAKQYDLFPVDESFFIGEKFGDESDFFLEYIDCMIKIGGGPQSIKEYKKFTKEKVEYSLDKGTYAGFKLSDDDTDFLYDYFKNIVPVPNLIDKKSFHITLLYSRKELPNYEPKKETNDWVYPTELDVFPTQDGKRCLVLLVKAPYCLKRHKELMKEHDATYDYDNYVPHITISYDIGRMRTPKLDEQMRKELLLDLEYKEELKLEWKPQ